MVEIDPSWYKGKEHLPEKARRQEKLDPLRKEWDKFDKLLRKARREKDRKAITAFLRKREELIKQMNIIIYAPWGTI